MKYEQTLAHLQSDLENSREQYRQSHTELVDTEQRAKDLKVQLTSLQANHQETMEQLGEKSRLVVSLKTELDRMQQQNQSMADEVVLLCVFSFSGIINNEINVSSYLLFNVLQIAIYEDKLRKIRQELKKVQEINRETEEQVTNIYNSILHCNFNHAQVLSCI